jgi:hypothetical protein
MIVFVLPFLFGCGCEGKPYNGKVENIEKISVNPADTRDYTLMYRDGNEVKTFQFKSSKQVVVKDDVRPDQKMWASYQGKKPDNGNPTFDYVEIHVRSLNDINTISVSTPPATSNVATTARERDPISGGGSKKGGTD